MVAGARLALDSSALLLLLVVAQLAAHCQDTTMCGGKAEQASLCVTASCAVLLLLDCVKGSTVWPPRSG